MKNSPANISLCRNCRYYVPQGRRGGHCQILNVAVKSDWAACSLATSPFTSRWRELENFAPWRQTRLAPAEVGASDITISSDLFEEDMIPVAVEA